MLEKKRYTVLLPKDQTPFPLAATFATWRFTITYLGYSAFSVERVCEPWEATRLTRTIKPKPTFNVLGYFQVVGFF